MFVVAALGASAFPDPGPEALEARARAVAAALAAVARSHRLLVLHQGASTSTAPPGLPPDLDAATVAGAVGHLLARELRNELPQTEVVATQAQAVVGAGEAGAAPPCHFVEMEALRRLAQDASVLLCVACIPVALAADGRMVHSQATLDQDAAAACLATELGADLLLLLTDVDAVYADGPAMRERIAAIDPARVAAQGFAAHSLGAKLAAAARFAATRGSVAIIGAAGEAEALVAGRAGTRVCATD